MNIRKMINENVNKGNVYVNKVGDLFTEEKLVTRTKKQYIDDLKNANIPFNKGYEEYLEEVKHLDYCRLSRIIDFLDDAFNFDALKKERGDN